MPTRSLIENSTNLPSPLERPGHGDPNTEQHQAEQERPPGGEPYPEAMPSPHPNRQTPQRPRFVDAPKLFPCFIVRLALCSRQPSASDWRQNRSDMAANMPCLAGKRSLERIQPTLARHTLDAGTGLACRVQPSPRQFGAHRGSGTMGEARLGRHNYGA